MSRFSHGKDAFGDYAHWKKCQGIIKKQIRGDHASLESRTDKAITQMDKITAQEASKRLSNIFYQASSGLYQTVPKEILIRILYYEILSFLVHPLGCKHEDTQCSCQKKREEFLLLCSVFLYNELEEVLANIDDFKDEIDLTAEKHSISIKNATEKVLCYHKETLHQTRLFLRLPSDRELRKQLLHCSSLGQIEAECDFFTVDEKVKSGKASVLHTVGYHTWKLLETFYLDNTGQNFRKIIADIKKEALDKGKGQFFRNRDEVERLMKTHHAMKPFITALFVCLREWAENKKPLYIFQRGFAEKFLQYSLIFQEYLLNLKRTHHKIKNPHTTENTVILPFAFVSLSQEGIKNLEEEAVQK